MKDMVINMKKLLCPSMMCAEYGNLESEMDKLDQAGIDIFHIDIMDGSFVPNFGMGLQDTEYILKKAKKPVDVHLMIQNPSAYVELFAKMGVDIIYFHPEADIHAMRTLQKIVDASAKAGIAINPGTSVEQIEMLLNLADYVMVMTVNPGFAGQKYITCVEKKIEKLIKLKELYHYKLMIDGACSIEHITKLSSLGVDGFVLGTSALFNKDRGYDEIIKELRNN